LRNSISARGPNIRFTPLISDTFLMSGLIFSGAKINPNWTMFENRAITNNRARSGARIRPIFTDRVATNWSKWAKSAGTAWGFLMKGSMVSRMLAVMKGAMKTSPAVPPSRIIQLLISIDWATWPFFLAFASFLSVGSSVFSESSSSDIEQSSG